MAGFSPDIVLVAVDVRSAHNVGSLFRTCDGFGAGLVLTGISPRPLSDNASDDRLPHVARKAQTMIEKTALGAEQHIDWKYYKDFSSALRALRDEGYQLCAIEQAASARPLHELQYAGKIALIVGREVEGLSAEELECCDEIYEIPMQGKKESFNVATAAGIALYQHSRCQGSTLTAW